jgi:hypothetical protein
MCAPGNRFSQFKEDWPCEEEDDCGWFEGKTSAFGRDLLLTVDRPSLSLFLEVDSFRRCSLKPRENDKLEKF